MSKYCFWILADGMIVQPDSRHILAVASAPHAFGETEKSLQETFEKYGQSYKSNYEGKAREEVLLRVIHRNHTRIRKNQHKRCQHWSFQLFKATEERQRRIAEWAFYISSMTNDMYGDVIIHQFHDESIIKTSLDKLTDGYSNHLPRIITQEELVRQYA